MADYTFRVNLLHDGNTHQNQGDVLAVANSKTFYLPIKNAWLPNKKLKHGDTFTLSGAEGLRVKNMLSRGQISHLELVGDAAPALQLFSMGDNGLFSMKYDGDFSIGGRVWAQAWDTSVLPNPDVHTINNMRACSDGTRNYLLIEMSDGSAFLRLEPNGEVSVIDSYPQGVISQLVSFIYIGNNQVVFLFNNTDCVCLDTNGNFVWENNAGGFLGLPQLVFFDDQIFGFGFGSYLYMVDKTNGQIFGDPNSEIKKSRPLTWAVDSSFSGDVQWMWNPFVYNNKLYVLVYGDFSSPALVEVLPDTNEINFVCWFEDDYSNEIVALNMIADKSREMGVSVEEFLTTDYIDVYYYDGPVIHAGNSLFYKTPTVDNLVVQWADSSAWNSGAGNPTWTATTVEDVEYFPDQLSYHITYTEPAESGTYVLRMKYTDSEFWTYITVD
jgi:hypothetical protein